MTSGFVTIKGWVVRLLCALASYLNNGVCVRSEKNHIQHFEECWAWKRFSTNVSPDYQLADRWPAALLGTLSALLDRDPPERGSYALLGFSYHSPQGLAHSVSSAKVFKWVGMVFWNSVSSLIQAIGDKKGTRWGFSVASLSFQACKNNSLLLPRSPFNIYLAAGFWSWQHVRPWRNHVPGTMLSVLHDHPISLWTPQCIVEKLVDIQMNCIPHGGHRGGNLCVHSLITSYLPGSSINAL